LISIGAYRAGNNPEIDHATKMKSTINQFLQQDQGDLATLGETMQKIKMLIQGAQGAVFAFRLSFTGFTPTCDKTGLC